MTDWGVEPSLRLSIMGSVASDLSGSAWKSGLKTAKTLGANRTQTDQDRKNDGPVKTAGTGKSVRSCGDALNHVEQAS
jgi:hypothetical protein